MRITHVVDEELGTVELTLRFAGHADPDHTADVAWQGVNRVLATAAAERGEMLAELGTAVSANE